MVRIGSSWLLGSPVWQSWRTVKFSSAVWCSALQCVAVRCSVLQCVAVCCSVLQCVAAIHSCGCVICLCWLVYFSFTWVLVSFQFQLVVFFSGNWPDMSLIWYLSLISNRSLLIWYTSLLIEYRSLFNISLTRFSAESGLMPCFGFGLGHFDIICLFWDLFSVWSIFQRKVAQFYVLPRQGTGIWDKQRVTGLFFFVTFRPLHVIS